MDIIKHKQPCYFGGTTMTKDYFVDPFAFSKALLPSSVGFDSLFKTLESAQKQMTKCVYPPYNIKKTGDNKYVVELAVAGFGKTDIELEMHEGVLTITGSMKSDDTSEFLYKGIAERAFTRRFTLADTVEVKGADLINGMLKVWLENIIPDNKKPKKIDINGASPEPLGQLLTEENK
jgi:molecular chaperone IbpA